MELDTFTTAFLTCLFWSETDDNDNYFENNYTFEDIAPDSLTKIIAECNQFQSENMPMIENDLEQAGHDFCLTRNGHGAGFWDGDWSEYGDVLTAACKQYGECYLYVGDDGKLYI